ncbi:MAG TPA: ABC transporter substrate-binding protein [Acidimicrobiales bacterium]|nr:ABC transporter substrate-binding protein [Acidimicrobiales bacterium]
MTLQPWKRGAGRTPARPLRAGRLTARTALAVAVGSMAAVTLGATPGVSGASGSTLTIGMFQSFSGPTAPFGPELAAGCIPAVDAVNRAGGVLGHKMSCKVADDRGDPADAVPAADQLIASSPDLVGVIGPTSNAASATVPRFNRSHIPMFPDAGQSVFTKKHYGYFWRLFPPDATTGYAMALYAWDHGYRRAAAVFGTDISAGGSRSTAVAGFEALGGKIVLQQGVAENQTSYRSEVAALAAAKPQVVFTEASSQTSATYWSELKQQGSLVHIVGTDGTTSSVWVAPVSKAVGGSTFQKYYVGVQAYAPTSGPAWKAYKKAVLAAKSKLTKPINPWLSDSYSMGDYDAANLIALAILEAKSTSPTKFNPFIGKIANGVPGAVVVHSFAQGKSEIAKGKKIRYEGPYGTVKFSSTHNAVGDFEVIGATLNKIVSSLTGPKVQAVQVKATKKK